MPFSMDSSIETKDAHHTGTGEISGPPATGAVLASDASTKHEAAVHHAMSEALAASDRQYMQLLAKFNALKYEAHALSREKLEFRDKLQRAQVEIQGMKQSKAFREDTSRKNRSLVALLDAPNEHLRVIENWKQLTTHINYPSYIRDIWRKDRRAAWDKLDDEIRDGVLEWAPNAERYLESTSLFLSFLRAWIWRILESDMFLEDDCEDKYNGIHLWAEFGAVSDVLRRNNARNLENERATVKYHLWRHLGASMLNQTHPLQIDTKHIAARIKRELGPFLRGTKEDKKVLGEIGDDIASTAARITRAIQIQKANYCVMYVDPDTLDDRDFRFEPGSSTMKCYHRRLEPGTVEFIVSPLLRLYGTPDGLDYDKFEDLFPMEVVVTEDEDLQKPAAAAGATSPPPTEPEAQERYNLRSSVSPQLGAKVAKPKAAAKTKKSPKRKDQRHGGQEGSKKKRKK